MISVSRVFDLHSYLSSPSGSFFEEVTRGQKPETDDRSKAKLGWRERYRERKTRKAKATSDVPRSESGRDLTTEDQEESVDTEDHAESKPPKSLSSRVWGVQQTKRFFRARRDAIRSSTSGFSWRKKRREKGNSENLNYPKKRVFLSRESSIAYRSPSRSRGRQVNRDAPDETEVASSDPLTVIHRSPYRERSRSHSSLARTPTAQSPSRLSRKRRNTFLSGAFNKSKSPSRLPSAQGSRTGSPSNAARASQLTPQTSFSRRSRSPRVRQIRSPSGSTRNVLCKPEPKASRWNLGSEPGPRATSSKATGTHQPRLDQEINPEAIALARQYWESRKNIHVAPSKDASDPLTRNDFSVWAKKLHKSFTTLPKDAALVTVGSSSNPDIDWRCEEPVIPANISSQTTAQSQNATSSKDVPTTAPEAAGLGRKDTCTTYHSTFGDQEERENSDSEIATVMPHYSLPKISHTITRQESGITGPVSPPSLAQLSAVAAYKKSLLTRQATTDVSQGYKSTRSRSAALYPTQTRIMRAGYKHTSPIAAGTMRDFKGRKPNGEFEWGPRANLIHRPFRQSRRR